MARHAPAPTPTVILAAREAPLQAIAQRTVCIEGLFARDLHNHPDSYAIPVENLRAVLVATFDGGTRAGRTT